MSSTGSLTLPAVATPARRRGRPRKARSPSKARSPGKATSPARRVMNPKTGRMVKVGGRAYRHAMGLVKHRKPRSARKSPKKAKSPRSPKRARRASPKKVRSPKRRVGRLASGQKIVCRVAKKAAQ